MLASSSRTDTAERRRHPRCTLPIRSHVSFSGTFHDATLRDISLGGLSLETDVAVAAREGQLIHLAFTSQIGVLEVQARIVRLRESTHSVRTALAVAYASLGETEELILSSLLEGAA